MIQRTLTAGILLVTSLIGLTPTGKVTAQESVVLAGATTAPTDDQIVTTRFDFHERGSNVVRLQRILKVKPANGVYGPKTWEKHRAYLIAHKQSTSILPSVPKAFTDVWYTVKYGDESVDLPLDKSKRCIQFEDEIRAHKLPVDIFSYLAWRESRCIPQAVGWNYVKGKGPQDCKHAPFKTYLRNCKHLSSFDSGLMQVNSSWWTVTKNTCGKYPQQGALFSLDCNLKVSRYLLTHTKKPMGNWGF